MTTSSRFAHKGNLGILWVFQPSAGNFLEKHVLSAKALSADFPSKAWV